MKLTYIFSMYKTTLLIKNGLNSINILYTDSYKKIPIHCGQKVKIFESAFKYVCIELNKEKLTQVIHMCKNMHAIKMVLIVLIFHIQDLTKDCGYILF